MTTVVTALEDGALKLGEAILAALINEIGLDGVLQLIFSRGDRNDALAILRAQYITNDVAGDALEQAKLDAIAKGQKP